MATRYGSKHKYCPPLRAALSVIVVLATLYGYTLAFPFSLRSQTLLPIDHSSSQRLGGPFAAPEGNGTKLWRTWEAMPGAHPLCNPDFLRAQMAPLPFPPQINTFQGARPTAAAVTIIGRHAYDAANYKGTNSEIGLERMAHALALNFPSQDEYFYSLFGIDYVVLLQEGSGVDCAILNASHALGWTVWSDGSVPPFCNSGAVLNSTGLYRSKRGTRIVVKSRDFALPRFLQRKPSLLADPNWLGCGGFRRDVSYNLYSGAAYSHHVLVEPVLDNYEVTFKMDVDVHFLKRPPLDPLEAILGCSIGVTKVFPFEVCNTNTREAVTYFGTLTGQGAGNAIRKWLIHGDFTYGMFNAGLSQVLRSARSTVFHTWLYECVEDGYFRYRWGDQASWTLLTGMWRDMGEDLKNSTAVCLWPWKQWGTGEGLPVLRHGWSE